MQFVCCSLHLFKWSDTLKCVVKKPITHSNMQDILCNLLNFCIVTSHLGSDYSSSIWHWGCGSASSLTSFDFTQIGLHYGSCVKVSASKGLEKTVGRIHTSTFEQPQHKGFVLQTEQRRNRVGGVWGYESIRFSKATWKKLHPNPQLNKSVAGIRDDGACFTCLWRHSVNVRINTRAWYNFMMEAGIRTSDAVWHCTY